MSDKNYGFFVKIDEQNYKGPFDRLGETREAAAKLDNAEIYHGTLKKVNGKMDVSDLSIVPAFK